jgi:xanthine dehydrogenase accessory factor
MNIFHNIADLLAGGESLALATIVSRSGSAPRAVGSRMVVRPDGASMGSIGGGILEARVRDLARVVCGHGQAVFKEYLLTAGDASRMGMVCGGTVQVLVQFLDAGLAENRELYRQIAAACEAGRPARLITAMPSSLEIPGPAAQCLVNDAEIMGDLDRQTVQTLTAQADPGQQGLRSYGGRLFLVEALGHDGVVYIFGAGHVSQQLAPLTRRVGFHTVVLDDRQEFANHERFPDADEVKVLDSFAQALAGLEITADSYLVLVTRGHAHDQTVLRQALATPAGYIGMIGSRRKREAIYAALAQDGFSSQDCDRVCSPIGLAIGAETPEEIAVSIVAELIQQRAARKR